mmetsp:Transcript_14797/g.46580  ORF Transcript_14797/g.46580 Transcript_14797/m.46580 type:complete len:369 (-) Transcript_14797:39-1145(-)
MRFSFLLCAAAQLHTWAASADPRLMRQAKAEMGVDHKGTPEFVRGTMRATAGTGVDHTGAIQPVQSKMRAKAGMSVDHRGSLELVQGKSGGKGESKAKACMQAAEAKSGHKAEDFNIASMKDDWSYFDTAHWKLHYPACAGASQSPIDIRIQDVDRSRATEKLSSHLEYAPPMPCNSIKNTGHSLQVNGEFGTFALPDGIYHVKQFHFHSPSEHSVNGKLAAAEMHIVHQREGATGTDDLAVIGILFDPTSHTDSHDPQLEFLRSLGFETGVPSIHNANALTEEVDLAAFASQLNGEFYHYSGSLTTPPCSETVHWYVAAVAAPITDQMVATLRKAMPKNNRPVQPLNGRKVISKGIFVAGEFGGTKR